MMEIMAVDLQEGEWEEEILEIEIKIEPDKVEILQTDAIINNKKVKLWANQMRVKGYQRRVLGGFEKSVNYHREKKLHYWKSLIRQMISKECQRNLILNTGDYITLSKTREDQTLNQSDNTQMKRSNKFITTT